MSTLHARVVEQSRIDVMFICQPNQCPPLSDPSDAEVGEEGKRSQQTKLLSTHCFKLNNKQCFSCEDTAQQVNSILSASEAFDILTAITVIEC